MCIGSSDHHAMAIFRLPFYYSVKRILASAAERTRAVKSMAVQADTNLFMASVKS